MGSPGAAGCTLLYGYQPLDGERLCDRLRTQSAPRRDQYRAGTAARLADRDTECPDRLACRSSARPRRPDDCGNRKYRTRRLGRRGGTVPARLGVILVLATVPMTGAAPDAHWPSARAVPLACILRRCC